ncbi:hypothetical protein NKR23_g3539 [Pleurostoma richardsiae]|uniref:Autophagy-related protein 1 n=1 Tax=Pleurostoma richardsiae TaxID=41990 RepID=A0AA38VTF2_9PEZI|nr:hypothetical protein NKR23_g3539 [Pleurostoma richardsiae]
MPALLFGHGGPYLVDYRAMLGSGSYADVYRGVRTASGQPLAFKHLRLPYVTPQCTPEDRPSLYPEEVCILEDCQHGNIVKWTSFVERPRVLVTELVEPGCIHSAHVDTVEKQIRLLKQMLEVLIYLHAKGVAH